MGGGNHSQAVEEKKAATGQSEGEPGRETAESRGDHGPLQEVGGQWCVCLSVCVC